MGPRRRRQSRSQVSEWARAEPMKSLHGLYMETIQTLLGFMGSLSGCLREEAMCAIPQVHRMHWPHTTGKGFQCIANDIEHVLGRKAKPFINYARETAKTGVWN